MPLYEIKHLTPPFCSTQKADLALPITQNPFPYSSPHLVYIFVNIRFTDTTNHDIYIDGKKVRSNSRAELILSCISCE